MVTTVVLPMFVGIMAIMIILVVTMFIVVGLAVIVPVVVVRGRHEEMPRWWKRPEGLAVIPMIALVGTDLDTGDTGRRELQLNTITGVTVPAEAIIDLPGLEMLDGGTKDPAG